MIEHCSDTGDWTMNLLHARQLPNLLRHKAHIWHLVHFKTFNFPKIYLSSRIRKSRNFSQKVNFANIVLDLIYVFIPRYRIKIYAEGLQKVIIVKNIFSSKTKNAGNFEIFFFITLHPTQEIFFFRNLFNHLSPEYLPKLKNRF